MDACWWSFASLGDVDECNDLKNYLNFVCMNGYMDS